jgi:hypothetical protein
MFSYIIIRVECIYLENFNCVMCIKFEVLCCEIQVMYLTRRNDILSPKDIIIEITIDFFLFF